MDFQLGQSTDQRLTQELTLSAQQLQSLNLLATPVMELRSLVYEELQKNPVLEADLNSNEFTLDVEQNKLQSEIINFETNYSNRSITSSVDESKRQHFFDSITADQSFEEKLLEQLRMLDLAPEEFELCKSLVLEIDDAAYLDQPVEDLATNYNEPEEEIRFALKIIHGLEPIGVAARNLRERLLLQLEHTSQVDTLAYTIVDQHLDELAANHLPQIAKSLQISMSELNDAIDQIRSLQPILKHPQTSEAEYVVPEVIVTIVEGELEVKVENRFIPTMRISKYYNILKENNDLTTEEKKYIKSKIVAAMEFIKQVENRQTTLDRVAQEIVKRQRAFFFEGEQALQPLRMADVAEVVGCHEATISRTANRKFLKCQHGVFPLKKFFSGSSTLASEDGNMTGAAVIDKIKHIIDNENVYKPLSDDKIVKILTDEGIDIARRTVAKYRGKLGILSSSKRKKFK